MVRYAFLFAIHKSNEHALLVSHVTALQRATVVVALHTHETHTHTPARHKHKPPRHHHIHSTSLQHCWISFCEWTSTGRPAGEAVRSVPPAWASSTALDYKTVSAIPLWPVKQRQSLFVSKQLLLLLLLFIWLGGLSPEDRLSTKVEES